MSGPKTPKQVRTNTKSPTLDHTFDVCGLTIALGLNPCPYSDIDPLIPTDPFLVTPAANTLLAC